MITTVLKTFNNYFVSELIDDAESEYEEQEIEVTDSEAEEEEKIDEKSRKLPRRRDLYTICRDNGNNKVSLPSFSFCLPGLF